MHYYIAWFQKNYSELHKDMIECNHNFDTQNLNPYHLESDCWSHTMMVCKIAELGGYDKVVQIAALLHDIGKPAARKVNPRNNHIQFFGHEEISACMAEDILLSMIEDELIIEKEKEEIVKLIENHSFLHNSSSVDSLLDGFKGRLEFCTHLIQLSRCDSLGRFHTDSPNEEKYQRMLDYLEKLRSNSINLSVSGRQEAAIT